MSAANLCMVSSLGTGFIFPLFLMEHQGSKIDIGIMMGIMALSSVLSRPLVSGMVDRFGRKPSYTVGALVMTAMPLTYLLFDGSLDSFYLPLLLVRLVHGLGLSICFTAAYTFMTDIIPENRMGEGLSMFGITGLVGMAIGPALGETVITHFGFTGYFISGAILGSGALLLSQPLKDVFQEQAVKGGLSFFQVLWLHRIRTVFYLALLFGVGLAASGGFVAPFAKVRGLTFVSHYYLSYSLAAVLTRVFGGRLVDRWGEGRVAAPALLLAACGPLLLFDLSRPMELVIAGLVFGCGHGFLFPSLNTLVIRGQPQNIRGKINGIYTGGIDGGFFAGSILLGYIGEWAGYPTVFLAAGLAFILGFVMYKRSGLENE